MRYLLLALFLLGCSAENPKMQPPPEVNTAEDVEPGTLVVDAEVKVDILFVVDDSASMQKHQESLASNIRNFTEQVEKNNLVDFHIAVTSVYDSKIKFELERRMRTDPVLASRQIVVNPLGELLQLRDFKTHLTLNGPRFITRETDNLAGTLASTLLVGAKPGPDQRDAPIIGPWFEELFSPVHYVLNNSDSPTNHGFYRKDAVFAVMFITDANDDSPSESASTLYDYLLNQKDRDADKVQAYAAIIPSGVTGCKRDDSLEPKKIEEFISLFQNSKSRILNLCSSDFGVKLADFGRDLASRIPPKIISFPKVPERDTIRVYYGDDLLEEKKQYYYSAGEKGRPHQIIIAKNFDRKLSKGAKFRVEFVPVRTENQKSGRTKKI